MSDATASQPPGHVIIGGFGIPGRFVAELLDYHSLPYKVIELNASMADRVAPNTVEMIVGDMRDEAVLRKAGIETATMVAITVPSEDAVTEIVQTVRRLRPDVQILVRCAYTSTGMKAQKAGANHVVVAEQLVAREFFRLIETAITHNPVHTPSTS
jgi:CPA2 family monovalent cation:H+ antiporter-2